MTKKGDMKGLMTGLMLKADASAVDRFAQAERIVETQPSGLTSKASAGDQNQSSAEAVKDVIWAPISLVRDNPRNARKLYDPAKVTARAASMRQDGQMTPAPACHDWENPGGFILIGGHYRKKGLLQNGETLIQLKLMPAKTYADLYRLSYVENDEREDGTAMDDALSWKEMLDSGEVKSQDEIAAIVKKPRTTVNKTLALLSVPEDILAILKDNPEKYTLSAGYELYLMSKVLGTEELLSIAQQVIKDELSTRDLIRIREEKAKPKAERKQKENSRQHKIFTDGEVVGTIKDWDSGKVVLEVQLADPIERQKLIEDLRARFGLTAEAAQMALPDK